VQPRAKTFDDGWEHTIKIERLADPEPGPFWRNEPNSCEVEWASVRESSCWERLFPASERGVNARSPSPASHVLCAAASPDARGFAEKRFHCR
jgi:hypothetical protein